jgi:hypothetical protein
VGGNGTLSGSNINNSNGDTLASIAVQTANSNSGGTNTITYRITRQTTTIAGDFTITFTATDSQSTGTSDTGAISFEVAFIISDSHFTSLLMATDGSAGDNDAITYDTGSTTGNSFTSIDTDHSAGTFSPYRHGGYSTYFDGNDYLSIAHSTDLDLGTGNFTIEGWWRFDDTSNQNLVSKYAANAGFVVQYQSGNLRLVLGLGGSDAVYSFSWTPVAETWYHVCILRDGTNGKAFINGTQIGPTTTLSTSNVGTTGTLQIGLTHTVSEYTRGYVSDVRIVKGTAITPTSGGPTERLTTVSGTEYSTSLLTCHLPYIADGSSNGHSITVNGNTSTKPTGPYDYGEYDESVNGGSILIDAYNKLITLDDSSSDFALGTTETTIKFWYYPMDADATAAQWLIRKGTNTAVSGYWALGHYSSNRLRFLIRESGGSLLATYSSNNVITPNAWNYIEWYQPTSGNGSIKVNGTEVISTGYSSNYGSTTDTLRLPQTTQNPTNGLYYADMQFVKGDARESSVPTAPMSTNTNAKLHVTGHQGHVLDKSQSANLKLVGNTAASTTQAKFSNTASVYFDGTEDYITIPNFEDIGSGDFTIEMFIYQTASGSYPTLFSTVANYATTNGLRISTGNNNNTLQVASAGSALINASSAFNNSTWNHIALVRSGTTLTLYLNGSSVGSATNSQSFVSDTFYIGDVTGTGSPYTFTGYIQDFRVTNGLARYTAADERSNIPSAPLKG